MHSLRVVSLSFIQDLTENYSPGNSHFIAICSKVVGEKPVYTWIFWLGNICSQVYILVKIKLLLITKNIYLKLMILVLSYVWKDARILGHWNSSWDMHLNYLGALFMQSTECLILLFPSWTPLGAHCQCTAVGCDLTFCITWRWVTLFVLFLFTKAKHTYDPAIPLLVHTQQRWVLMSRYLLEWEWKLSWWPQTENNQSFISNNQQYNK